MADFIAKLMIARFLEQDSLFVLHRIGERDVVGTLNDGQLPFFSTSSHYGESMFEGLRIDNVARNGSMAHAVVHPELNLTRLEVGAGEMGYELPGTTEDRVVSLLRLAVLNGYDVRINFNGEPIKTAYVRPFITTLQADSIAAGAETTFSFNIGMIPFPLYYGSNGGLRVHLSDIPRNPERPNLKVESNYQHASSARRGYVAKHPDVQELLFSDKGTAQDSVITEGPVENVAFVRGNDIITPARGCLYGFTMQKLGKIADSLGYNFRYDDISPKDMQHFEAAFFTGNAAGGLLIAHMTAAEGMVPGGKELSFDISNPVASEVIGEYNKVLNGSTKYGDMHSCPADVLHPEEIVYLRGVRREILAAKGMKEDETGAIFIQDNGIWKRKGAGEKGNAGWKLSQTDIGQMAEKRAILVALNPPKLDERGMQRISARQIAYGNMGFRLK